MKSLGGGRVIKSRSPTLGGTDTKSMPRAMYSQARPSKARIESLKEIQEEKVVFKVR